jgi:Gpi18-like mannosyltransferase
MGRAMVGTRFLEQAPSPRFVWLSVLAIASVHLVVWAVAASVRGIAFESLLLHYDASWYASIATRGYSGAAWAFYPLWPAVVSLVTRILPLGVAFVQALVAAGCFALTIRLFFTNPALKSPFVPETRLGWLLFALTPASYVFHSGHTEALFLLLVCAAFVQASRGAWLMAAVLAGLAGLTRNQGTFAAVAVGIMAYRAAPVGSRAQRFLLSGLVSGALFALYPLYQYLATGDPFTAVKAQSNWTQSHGMGDVLKTLVLGNRENPWEWATRARHPWFVGYLIACIAYFKKTRDLALTVFFLGCVLVVLPQGTVSNLFRYTVVLAALMFFVGDWLSKRHVLFQAALLVATLYFHAELTWNYGIHRWPY